MNKKLSVIIPVFNRKDLLKKSLNSLSNQSINKDEYEVIISDDGSSQNFSDLVSWYKKKINLKYIYQQNLGFRAGTARNRGAEIAEGDIILFIDTGVVLESHTLEKHIEVHKNSEKNLAILGYMYGFDELNENAQIINSLKIDGYNVDNDIKELQKMEIFDRREAMLKKNGIDLRIWKAPWIIFWTGHVSLSKNCFLNLSGFDESFDGWGYEDIDFGIRWFLNNNQIIMLKEIDSIHLPHDKFKSTLSKKERLEYSKTRKKILYNKHKLPALEIWFDNDTIEIEELIKRRGW